MNFTHAFKLACLGHSLKGVPIACGNKRMDIANAIIDQNKSSNRQISQQIFRFLSRIDVVDDIEDSRPDILSTLAHIILTSKPALQLHRSTEFALRLLLIIGTRRSHDVKLWMTYFLIQRPPIALAKNILFSEGQTLTWKCEELAYLLKLDGKMLNAWCRSLKGITLPEVEPLLRKGDRNILAWMWFLSAIRNSVVRPMQERKEYSLVSFSLLKPYLEDGVKEDFKPDISLLQKIKTSMNRETLSVALQPFSKARLSKYAARNFDILDVYVGISNEYLRALASKKLEDTTITKLTPKQIYDMEEAAVTYTDRKVIREKVRRGDFVTDFGAKRHLFFNYLL